MALTEKLGNIADAIRGKTGKTEEMTLDQMATEIAGIQTVGGGDTLDAFIRDELTEVTSDVTTLRDSTFYGLTALKSVDFPNLETMSANCFANCSALVNVDFPNLETMGNYCFMRTAVKSIVFPKLTDGRTDIFNNCSKLEVADFPVIRTLTRCFQNAPMLKAVILRKSDAICTLGSNSIFSGSVSPMNSGTGCIYVPQALIEEYKQATNWSSLYEQGKFDFVAIEGSEYE